MILNLSIPHVLSKAAPVFRYVGIAILILLTIMGGISGFISGLVYAALCWIMSFLCDAVVELYKQVEKLSQKTDPTAES